MGEKKVLINICKAPFGIISYTEGLRAGVGADRKSTRLNSSHTDISRMPSSA